MLAGLRAMADTKTIADKWVAHNAATLAAKSPEATSATDWLKMNTTLDSKALQAALEQVYGSGWAFGEADAQALLGALAGDPWAGWQAGNEAASALVSPAGGLQALLDKSGTVIDGISGTVLDQLGTALADSLAHGFGAQETANMLRAVIDNPAKAMVIARTETCRAIVDSNVAEYKASEVESIEWLVAEPCDICEENAGVIISIGDAFPSGDDYPPAHPNCVCDVAPVSSVE